PDLHVQVEGHTDNVGGVEFNQRLSEDRANTVRSFLVAQGVPPDSIASRGAGMSEPVASNGTAAGRQMNRRVDMVVSGQTIGNTSGALQEPAAQPTNPNPAPSTPAESPTYQTQPATQPPAPQH